MKKWMFMLASVALLAACENGETDNESVPEMNSEETEQESETTSDENQEEEDVLDDEPRTVELDEFTFVLPSEQEASEEDVEEVVTSLQSYANVFSGLALEGELTPIWSGIVDQDPETGAQRGAFILANDLGETITNISFTLGLEDEAGTVIWEAQEILLSEEEFGELETGQMKPFMVDVPQDSEQEFMNMLQNDLMGVPIVEEFEYETIEND